MFQLNRTLSLFLA